MAAYGYSSALKAAGATVIDFKSSGDYQGTWGAVVDYNGQRSVVIGAYGSCDHCDHFQARFGYENWDETELAEFGASYLVNPYYKEDVERQIAFLSGDEDDWFNEETLELYKWALTFFN